MNWFGILPVRLHMHCVHIGYPLSFFFCLFVFFPSENQPERIVIILNKCNIEEPPEMTGKIQNYVSFVEQPARFQTNCSETYVWSVTRVRLMVIITGICHVRCHTNSLYTATSVCVIINGLFNWYEKKSQEEKKRMCFLEYVKSNELPNLQLFDVFYGGKKIYEIPEKA